MTAALESKPKKETPMPPKPAVHAAPPEPPAEVDLSIPFQPSRAYAGCTVQGRLTPAQAATARCIVDALMQRQAKLNDGHVVQRPLDLFRWLLEESVRQNSALAAAVAEALR